MTRWSRSRSIYSKSVAVFVLLQKMMTDFLRFTGLVSMWPDMLKKGMLAWSTEKDVQIALLVRDRGHDVQLLQLRRNRQRLGVDFAHEDRRLARCPRFSFQRQNLRRHRSSEQQRLSSIRRGQN